MTDITCYKCGSTKITFYRQIRKDGEPMVTARCENGHSPVKGRPFFPKWKFNVRTLPPLPSQATEQAPLFEQPAPRTGMFVQSAPLFERLTGEK